MFPDYLEKGMKNPLDAVRHGRLKRERDEMAVEVDTFFAKDRGSQTLLLG